MKIQIHHIENQVHSGWLIDSRDAIIIFSFLFLSIDHSIGRFFFVFFTLFMLLSFLCFHLWNIISFIPLLFKFIGFIASISFTHMYFQLVMLQSYLCFKLWNIISFIPLLFKFIGFIASKLHSLIHKNKKLHNCFLIQKQNSG